MTPWGKAKVTKLGILVTGILIGIAFMLILDGCEPITYTPPSGSMQGNLNADYAYCSEYATQMHPFCSGRPECWNRLLEQNISRNNCMHSRGWSGLF
jgi:hypothetical protein